MMEWQFQKDWKHFLSLSNIPVTCIEQKEAAYVPSAIWVDFFFFFSFCVDFKFLESRDVFAIPTLSKKEKINNTYLLN